MISIPEFLELDRALLFVVNQLQGHGLSIGINARGRGGHGFAIAGNDNASAGTIFGF